MAFGLSVCSFGRSFLGCASGLPASRSPSLRRVLRVFLAARRRWPAGRLVVSLGSVRWDVDGSCGVMLSFGRDGFGRPDRWDRFAGWLLDVRCAASWPSYVSDCDVLGLRPSVCGFVRSGLASVAGRPSFW